MNEVELPLNDPSVDSRQSQQHLMTQIGLEAVRIELRGQYSSLHARILTNQRCLE